MRGVNGLVWHKSFSDILSMNDQKIYDKILTWIITFGPRILLAIGILIVGIWLIKLLKRWFANVLSRRKLDNSLKPFLQGTLTVTLQILLVLALLQVLGI